MKGFYVPGSKSGSYVANKRNEEGSLAYETAASEIGVQKQAAIQNLEQTYASTIENAYASYLSNQRSIRNAAMGQGYKEAYLEAQEQNLISSIAEANRTTASVRAELENQEQEARTTLEEQYKAEVANLDRVATSMNDYLTYVKSLTGKDDASVKYFSEEDEAKTIDDLYEQLYTAQPQSLVDEEGEAGKSYIQWVNSQLKDTEGDTTWANWLFYQGGWQDFIASTNKKRDTQAELNAAKAEEDRIAKENLEAEKLTTDYETKIKNKLKDLWNASYESTKKYEDSLGVKFTKYSDDDINNLTFEDIFKAANSSYAYNSKLYKYSNDDKLKIYETILNELNNETISRGSFLAGLGNIIKAKNKTKK